MPLWMTIAAVSGFLAVALGAFGAHGLEAILVGKPGEWFDTALRYHIFHSLALLAVALLPGRVSPLLRRVAGLGFTLGLLIFCGLLYLMALGAPTWLGAIVPLGGLSFLVGWFALALTGIRSRTDG